MASNTKSQIEYTLQEIQSLTGDLSNLNPDLLKALEADAFFTTFSNFLSAYLQLAEQKKQTEKLQRRIQIATDVNRELSRTHDFKKMATLVLRKIVAEIDPSGEKLISGTLRWFDLYTKELVIHASIGVNPENLDRRIKTGEGITGLAAERGKSVIVENLDDPIWQGRFIHIMKAKKIRSELAVPFLEGNEVVGILNLESPAIGAFNEDDQSLLEVIATQIVVSLRNAEEHYHLERERERQEVATDIMKLIGQTLEFDVVANRALTFMIDYLQTEDNPIIVGTLQQLDKESQMLCDIAGVRYEPGQENMSIALGQGVTGRVAQTGKPLLIPDLHAEQWKDVFVHVMREDIRSELAVPLIRDDEIWGVLNVESPKISAFDQDDQRLLETVAVQILLALRNAEDYRNLQRERERQQVVVDINRLLGQTLDFDIVANQALTFVIDYLQTEDGPTITGTLQYLDKKQGVLRDVAGIGYKPNQRDVPIPLGQGITGLVAKTQQALLIADLQTEEWQSVFVDVMIEKSRSELAVPLIRNGELWGVLNVESPAENTFSKDDQRLLEAVADQIILALRNAEVHQKLLDEQGLRIAAEEWSTLSDTAAGLTHHLGNYTGAVGVALRFIKDILIENKAALSVEAYENLQKYLMVVSTNTQTTKKLINRLYNEYTGVAPTIELIDINSVLKRALNMTSFPDEITVIQELADNLPFIEADATRLIEVAAELLRNAQKAMPQEKGRITIGSRHSHKFVEFWVADNGSGVLPEDQEKVFQLFYRKDDSRPGFGIGLPGVRNRIQRFNGHISLRSDGQDKGTVVTVQLPAIYQPV